MGDGWEQFIDPSLVAATFLPNHQVSAAYRSAGVVLSDHWDDMAREGFVSNRIFDALASAARVVSDPVAGLNDLFGGSVPTYSGAAELAALCTAPHDERFPSEAARVALARRIAVEHSFQARAARLVEVVDELTGVTAGLPA